MASKIPSAALIGVDAAPVDVEADIAQGLPKFVIVGLPDTAVSESRERVKPAIKNSGLPFPTTRLTVNLAPADIRKEGPGYDLPIAVAVLEAQGVVPPMHPGPRRLFYGELALDGSLRPLAGALAVAVMAAERGFDELYLPSPNAGEASLASGVRVFPVDTLARLVRHLRGEDALTPLGPRSIQAASPGAVDDFDFAFIRGQTSAKRALEIAAAGAHNVLLSGPPGSGKTLLARALPSIMPPMTDGETIEVTKIHGVAGLAIGAVVTQRPFRSPHHTASGAALIGGGTWPRPGEVTLAHRGVLFLDEFPEFPRQAIENLRQPLEDGFVTVSRANGTVRFPAKFMLIAARNPCPCGYAGDPSAACSCAPVTVAKYGRKISGPILDRIDLHVEVPKMPVAELFERAAAEPSSVVRERVRTAREKQAERFADERAVTNAEMSHAMIRRRCPVGDDVDALLRDAARRMALSARAVTRVIRLARTIADLEGAEHVGVAHAAEALHYRERQS